MPNLLDIPRPLEYGVGGMRCMILAEVFCANLGGSATMCGDCLLYTSMNDKEHQVKLLIDEEVLNSEYFGCHPCINTSSLRMRTADPVSYTHLNSKNQRYVKQ